MTLLRRIQFVAGIAVTVNALLWLGCPVRVDALAGGGFVEAASAALYAVGLCGFLMPISVLRTRHVAPYLISAAGALGYIVMLAALHFFGDSPAYDALGAIPLGVLATWMLTSGFVLIMTALWRPGWFGLYEATYRVLEGDEVRDAYAGYAEALAAE